MSHADGALPRKELGVLALGALGVVYGDIGTSPLYAIKECFSPEHALDSANVLGVLSLVFWSLMLVVVLKYLTLVMRADNHGEGGILALVALVIPHRTPGTLSRPTMFLLLAGLFGSALLYGDGMITPAISVLSAIEGLEVATTKLTPFVVPVTVIILIGLFLIQRKGTGGIGAVFGPAMLIWFAVIGALGVPWIVRMPRVLLALNPYYGVRFVLHGGFHHFLLLGSVVLCITGAEALYADMGHFGRRPIRIAWYAIVMPALLLNYFGQGALLLANGAEAARNPFFALAPTLMLYPLVGLATIATVIASQALISGAFSLTQQAVLLGYWPRVKIVHTSETAAGQIYIPEINNALMIACVALVLGFKSSSNLAAAYGVAVTATMAITSLLLYTVATQKWRWSKARAIAFVVPLLAIDLAFLGANIPKIVDGGWFPLAIGAAVYTIMTTWRKGRSILAAYMSESTLPVELFMTDLDLTRPHRVAGTAVFMTSMRDGIPPVLLHHFKHNKVLHEQVVLLSVATEDSPVVPIERRVELVKLGHGFFHVTARFGFMQHPNVLAALARCAPDGLCISPDATSFYLGRDSLLVTGKGDLPRWRKLLFAFLSRNARTATDFFGLPPNRVVEMGAQIEL